jgi:hypothetical protein
MCGGGNSTLPRPFDLPYRMLPCTKLRKSFFEVELKNLIAYYRGHRDLINLKGKWNMALTKTREDKLIDAI